MFFSFIFFLRVFPNIFDDALGIMDSFNPFVDYEEPRRKDIWSRIALFGVCLSVGIYYYNQPSEFEELVKSNTKFMTDLYEGNVLSDIGATHQESADHNKEDNQEKYKKPSSLKDFEGWDIEEDHGEEEGELDDFLDKMVKDQEREDARTKK